MKWFSSLCAGLLGMMLLFGSIGAPAPSSNLTPREATATQADEDAPRILVYSRTTGWRHSSIPHGIEAIRKLGEEHGFSPTFTEDPAWFVQDSLQNFRAVVFLNTTRNVLNAAQQTAFERYIQAGGGFVGIHSAADTEYEWPWYGELVGARLESHVNHPNVRNARLTVAETDHPATHDLPGEWTRDDEWYNYRSFYPRINELLMLDEESFDGGTNGTYHPIAWYHAYDGGRAFYTGLGHTDESFTEPLFLQHLLGGIRYAMGDGAPLDFARAYSIQKPEENRFEKTVLVGDLNEPMELAVAPDGRVFFTELDGTLSVWDPATGEASLVHQFDVSSAGGSGLIGVTLDPDFSRNNHIYLYYSPPSQADEFDFRLSRFEVTGRSDINLASEAVVLTVRVSRQSGAHHGGSLAWDSDGNLILSTGDTTPPHPAEGYAPLDERPGDGQYVNDAQRSAANTNALTGKILRIKPQPDGTYTVPDGNLFTPGTPQTRPEIYVMGARNPYRIAVNPQTGAVYWGEIGPDAGEDSPNGRGPRGYDEFNVAREAGNFGWPYFVGNNRPYAHWDYDTRTAGQRFDPARPVNDSPNNTGLRVLPPAQPAFIYYPYAASQEFPEFGEGGRSAMAGDFYTFDPALDSPVKFPEYYDGALFVFEWMRNFVKVIRVDEEDAYLGNEPFMDSNGDFRRPIDLAFGPDGAMYMLEYGSIYGIDNDDARLVRISYNAGNRPPVATARIRDAEADSIAAARSWLTSDRRYHSQTIRETAGAAPLTITLIGSASDPDDDDETTFEWTLDGQPIGTRPFVQHTFEKPGTYRPVLRVTDAAGAVGTDTLVVRVGNMPPILTVESPHNTTFFDGRPFSYAVAVEDAEDGRVDPSTVDVEYAYFRQPAEMLRAMGDDASAPAERGALSQPLGALLIAGSDCQACHTVDAMSIGPSYTAIADRYRSESGSVSRLARKIIEGGGGNWGETPMSAHPQLSEEEAEEIVRYVFSLTDSVSGFTAIPASGVLTLDRHAADEPHGRYVIRARYTDRGATGAEPITSEQVITLRPSYVPAVFADEIRGFPRWGNSLSGGKHKSHLMLRDVDFTALRGFDFGFDSWGKPGTIEVRIDSYAGPVVARADYELGRDVRATAKLESAVEGRHDVYFIVRQPDGDGDVIMMRGVWALLDDVEVGR